MILNKIAKSLKNRDWGAAIIEIGIVVIGIFIGLQVDDWNQGRLDRIEEQEILSKLLLESERAVIYISAQTDRFEEQINGLEELVAYLDGDKPLPEDVSSFRLGFNASLFYPQMKPAKAVFEEVSSAGRLSLIRDEEIRFTLSLYQASLEAYDSQLDYFRQFANNARGNPYIYSDGVITYAYDPDSPQRRSIEYDFEAMKSNQKLIDALLTSLRNQRNFHYGSRMSVLESIKNVCTTIAKTINKQCRAIEQGS